MENFFDTGPRLGLPKKMKKWELIKFLNKFPEDSVITLDLTNISIFSYSGIENYNIEFEENVPFIKTIKDVT